MRKLKLEFTTYPGISVGFVVVNNHFERGICFILPFFSVDFIKKLK